MRRFELDIALRYRAAAKIRASPKGEWIRNHLLEVGEDYPYRMWKRFRAFAEEAKEELGVKIRTGTYQSFMRYIRLLKDLNLIIPIRRTPSQRPALKPRVIYTINPEKIEDPAWTHPYQALYPTTQTSYRRKHGLPIPRKRTGRPRGRPPKKHIL